MDFLEELYVDGCEYDVGLEDRLVRCRNVEFDIVWFLLFLICAKVVRDVLELGIFNGYLMIWFVEVVVVGGWVVSIDVEVEWSLFGLFGLDVDRDHLIIGGDVGESDC